MFLSTVRQQIPSRHQKTWFKGCQLRYMQSFAAGGYVWIHVSGRPRPHWRQIPLRPEEYIRTSKGSISAKDVLGRHPHDTVKTTTGISARLEHPTLEEHILYIDRTVTPIYPRDANLIVSQLDFHPDPNPSVPDINRFEILEAGTGMGGLTLHLARALHGVNPPASESVRHAAKNSLTGTLGEAESRTLDEYRSRRQSVVHSIERKTVYAAHAQRVIATFRDGLYSPTIDQHVGHVADWIELQLHARQDSTAPATRPFLNHAILDMPESHLHTDMVTLALKPGGRLLLWTPSISQVQDAVLHMRATGLPLVLDDVLEAGVGLSGGRPWDVRLTPIRNKIRAAPPDAAVEQAADEALAVETEGTDLADTQMPPEQEAAWGLVSRPRAVSVGGGASFLAVFRKLWPDEGLHTMRRQEWFKKQVKSVRKGASVRVKVGEP